MTQTPHTRKNNYKHTHTKIHTQTPHTHKDRDKDTHKLTHIMTNTETSHT